MFDTGTFPPEKVRCGLPALAQTTLYPALLAGVLVHTLFDGQREMGLDVEAETVTEIEIGIEIGLAAWRVGRSALNPERRRGRLVEASFGARRQLGGYQMLSEMVGGESVYRGRDCPSKHLLGRRPLGRLGLGRRNRETFERVADLLYLRKWIGAFVG